MQQIVTEEVVTPKGPREVLSTEAWATLGMLHCPASQVTLAHGDRPHPEPLEAKILRIEEWNKKIDAKLKELSEVNPTKSYCADADPTTGQKTLFEIKDGEKIARMWDGVTISPSGDLIRTSDGGWVLNVHSIQYSEWTSCTNPEYAAAHRRNGVPLPYAGVGVSVLLETTDGFIPLTRRGIETPVYPGHLYSPGGGPKQGQSSVTALLEEIAEETGLQKGKHFNASELVMLAYVSDSKHQNSDHERPELVAYLPLKISVRDICDIRDEYLQRKKVPETDVWAYELLRADQANMSGMVVLRGNEMCPPTEAALCHLMYYKLLQKREDESAMSEMRGVMDRVTQYGRDPYKVPIHKLSR